MLNKYGALIMWGSLIKKGTIKYTPNLSKTRVINSSIEWIDLQMLRKREKKKTRKREQCWILGKRKNILQKSLNREVLIRLRIKQKNPNFNK